jgi:hypothetical protein
LKIESSKPQGFNFFMWEDDSSVPFVRYFQGLSVPETKKRVFAEIGPFVRKAELRFRRKIAEGSSERRELLIHLIKSQLAPYRPRHPKLNESQAKSYYHRKRKEYGGSIRYTFSHRGGAFVCQHRQGARLQLTVHLFRHTAAGRRFTGYIFTVLARTSKETKFLQTDLFSSTREFQSICD